MKSKKTPKAKPKKQRETRDPIARRFEKFRRLSSRSSWTDKQAREQVRENDALYGLHLAAELLARRGAPSLESGVLRQAWDMVADGRRPPALGPSGQLDLDALRDGWRQLLAGGYVEQAGQEAQGPTFRRTDKVLPFRVSGSRVVHDPAEVAAEAVALGADMEQAEHDIPRGLAEQLARDHLARDPTAYDAPALQRDLLSGRFQPAQVQLPRAPAVPARMPAPPTPQAAGEPRREVRAVRSALERRVERVAAQAQRLAEGHASRRGTLVAALRKAARAKPTPANTRRLAAGRARLRDMDRQHRVRLRELAKSGACPPMPRARCKDSCGLKLEGSFCAGDAPLVLPSPDGPPRRVKARYCLTSASRLVASHDPITWIPRPDYPRDTQERRYESDPAEQLKIVRISEKLDPTIILSDSASGLDGPPVVTAEGWVAGGNGRTMGVQRAYRTGHGAGFRSALRERAKTFGLKPEDVDRYEDPIVVRVVEVDERALPRLVRDLNQQTTQAMDRSAEAVSAARVMTPAVLDALSEGLGEMEELADFLASPRSKPLVRALEAAGVVTSANRNRLLTPTGLLSEDGRALVISQLAAALVQDAATLDAIGGQVRGALARSAPWWIAASASPGYDVRRAFTLAAKDLVSMRRDDLTLQQYRRRVGMFEDIATSGDPLAAEALDVLVAAGARPIVMTRIARAYRRISRALSSAPLLLASDPIDEAVMEAQQNKKPLAPEEALRLALKYG